MNVSTDANVLKHYLDVYFLHDKRNGTDSCKNIPNEITKLNQSAFTDKRFKTESQQYIYHEIIH